RHEQAEAELPGVDGGDPRETESVFARNNSLGKHVGLAQRGIGVAVEEFGFTLAGREKSDRTRLYPLVADRRRAQVFVEEIGEGRRDVRVNEKNSALCGRARGRKISGRAVAHVDKRGFEALRRSSGRKPLGDQGNGKANRAEEVQAGCSFGPVDGEQEFFCWDVDAPGAQSHNPPRKAFGHLTRDAYSASQIC